MLPKPIKPKTIIMLGTVLAGLAFSFSACALDYRSIALAKVVTYDAPSKEATKLFILTVGYPVEVIVNLGDWIKVRDSQGGLSWLEGKSLSAKRTGLVLGKTEIKITEDDNAALAATVEKDVVLELLPGATKSGWQKVKHRDGVTGFVPVEVLWGAN